MASFSEAYVGTDPSAAAAACQTAPQGEAILVVFGSHIPPRIVQVLDVVGEAQGQKLWPPTFNDLMLAFRIEQLFTAK